MENTNKKKTPVWVWVLLGAVGLPFVMCTGMMVVGAGAVAAVSAEQDRQSAEVQAAATAAQNGENPSANVLDVELTTLLSEYEDNEVRADSSFKKKIIRVTGRVDDIKKGLGGSPYITVGTGKAFEIPQVQCSLAKESEGVIANLSKGDTITVVGRVSGLMMNVHLSDCVVKVD